MLLDTEKSGEQDLECFKEWLVNTEPNLRSLITIHAINYFPSINTLPNNKIFDWSKLKVHLFADNKINVSKKLKFLLGWVENIFGKGESAGSSIFSFSYHVFKKNLPRVINPLPQNATFLRTKDI